MAADFSPPVAPRQRVVRARRTYNQWVADQTLEDYALRYTPPEARVKRPIWVANTALGATAFLACEVVGAVVAIQHGVTNGLVALAIAAGIYLLCGVPICTYGSRHGVDMDLLTRGAGFGYLGSTITSAIYVCFTILLFSIEAIILSGALEFCFGIPLALAHVISAFVIIPLSLRGFRAIGRLQNWTQPVWIVLQCAPLIYLAQHQAEVGAIWRGDAGTDQGLSAVGVGANLAILLALLPQIGEQVDYLRFLPEREKVGRLSWWSVNLLTGPGWIMVGGMKILIGATLALMAVRAGIAATDAANPTLLYFRVFDGLLGSPEAALLLAGGFVALCQIKINVTNAYAGSIASSNFFSRLTQRHPGRVLWLVLNVLIALMLMEIGIMGAVEHILRFYSSFAAAWFAAVTADLLISKPLGLSPPGIEFKRSHLFDINPAGVGALLLSIAVAMFCLTGLAGPVTQAFAPLVGFAVAFVAEPAIAAATRGRYYLARPPEATGRNAGCNEGKHDCVICENRFVAPDVAHCPVYSGTICSLCCSLDARCGDACKDHAAVVPQATRWIRRFVPKRCSDAALEQATRFALLFGAMAGPVGLMLFLVSGYVLEGLDPASSAGLIVSFRIFVVGLLAFLAMTAWYLTLAHESRRAAEEESKRQTGMLIEEIEAHRRTDAELQKAKEMAEAANLAKSRYVIGVSHEIRTPLNAISGYAQLLERDPTRHLAATRVIRRSANHLGALVEGLIDISRIENGSIVIERKPVALTELLQQIVDMNRLNAMSKGISFVYEPAERLPAYVYTDGKRLRQILVNLVSNAIKYTVEGEARLTVKWRNPVAEFIVSDTGVGMAPEHLDLIFEPFQRLDTVNGEQGVGIGLTITRLLATLLGGEIQVESQPGLGSSFRFKLFLSEAPSPQAAPARRIAGHAGRQRRIVAADDDPVHLAFLRDVLEPIGFALETLESGEACVATCVRNPTDLVILDVSMPGIDGWETARRLRIEVGEDPMILMISANVQDFRRQRKADDPHDDFLTKPYEIDDLLDRIRTLLSLEWRMQDVEP